MDDEPSAAAVQVQEEVQGEGLPPKRKHRATKAKAQEPKAQAPDPQESKPREADPLFFPMLLITQRQMEKEARHAKISSLRIC